MPIMNESLIEHAEIELSRSHGFRAYVDARLQALRALHPDLPMDTLKAIRVTMANGQPLAQALLDGYWARATSPQWKQASE
jgi:hypothetical protein